MTPEKILQNYKLQVNRINIPNKYLGNTINVLNIFRCY